MRNSKFLVYLVLTVLSLQMHRAVVLRWLLLLIFILDEFKMFRKESLLQDVKSTYLWSSVEPCISKNYISIWKCLEIDIKCLFMWIKNVWIFARTTSKKKKIANDILVYIINKILHPISGPQ